MSTSPINQNYKCVIEFGGQVKTIETDNAYNLKTAIFNAFEDSR